MPLEPGLGAGPDGFMDFLGTECRIATILRTGRKCDTTRQQHVSLDLLWLQRSRPPEGPACHVQSSPAPSLSSAHRSPEFWEGKFPSVFTAWQQIDEASDTESSNQ